MKKNFLPIAVVLILLAIISLGLYYLRNQKEFNTDALDAVPISSECIMQFSSIGKFHKVLQQPKGIIKDINKFDGLRSVKVIVDSVISALKSNESFSEINLDKKLTCATKLTGKSNVELLFILPISNYSELGSVETFIGESLKGFSINKRNYSGETITRYQKGKEELHISFVEGLLLMSRSTIFLEDAIRQIATSPKLKDIDDFNKVYRTSGLDSDINIFINNGNVSRLLRLIASKDYLKFFSSVSGWASWTALDIEIDDNYIQLDGFTKTADKRFDMFDMFVSQHPVESKLINVIPSGVATFSLMSLSDVKKFRDDNKKYLGQIGRLRSYRKGMTRLKRLYGCDFEDDFYGFFEGEAAMVSLSVNSLDINKDKVAVFRTKGGSMVREHMMKCLGYYAKKNNRPLSYYSKEIVIDSEKKFKIYNLAVDDIPYKLFGKMFLNVPAEYFTIVDNYLVFGGSRKVLSDYMHSYVLNKNIKSDILYKECSKLLSSKGNFLFYSNTSSSMPLFTNYLKPKVKDVLNKNKENISKFYSTCYQFSAVNNMIFNNLFFMYSEKLKDRPHTIWESGLDAGIKMKPVIVKNHRTKEKEIFVQDENNNIYLLNSMGRILWKLPIDGKINSEVFQVDKYRNNKLQYLFSTKDKIFLIDRNGNHVGRFPIMIKSPSDKGITVFDYDSSRKYRIFVPCINKRVYLYDMDGNVVKGWGFKHTENKIITKVNHFRIGKKDYIVLADEFKVYILDRRGRIRAKTDKYFNVSANAEFVLVNGKNPSKACLLITDTKGDVYKIRFNGRINKYRSFDNFSPKHRFIAEDLDGDKQLEYIFSDGNKLKAFSNNKKIVDFEVDGNIGGIPSIFSFAWNDKKIGILDNENNFIYLINKNGKIFNGFPVQGKSPFSISFMRGKNRGFNMFVGSSGKSLYNYKVQMQ